MSGGAFLYFRNGKLGIRTRAASPDELTWRLVEPANLGKSACLGALPGNWEPPIELLLLQNGIISRHVIESRSHNQPAVKVNSYSWPAERFG